MAERWIRVVVATAWLAGCSAPQPAPIEDRARSMREPDSALRTVVRGDTLYSIAWESGRDFRELAAWNGISPPYTLRPGQTIRVVPPDGAVAAPAGKPPSVVSAQPAPPARAEPPPRATQPPPSVADRERKAPAAPAVKPAEKAAQRPAEAGAAGNWTWPSQGPVLARFSDSGGSKGIDIGGTAGQAVIAAADGRVVYQGSGLRGYGQLIIVKHSEEFLSAYAHNERIYVKEGDNVKRGQKIAAMGRTGADRVKLHFEIRRNGTPVDPLRYLPKK